jgi:hypothetical protein
MGKLQKLLSLSKCTVHLTVNQHRNYYETVQDRINDLGSMECPVEIEDEILAVMISTDTMIELQFYPDTPIGSYCIYHYDLDSALDEALACFPENVTGERR